MDTAWQYADYLMQTVKQKPMELLKHVKPEAKWKSLQQKLTDLYVTGCSTTFKNKNLFGGSQLLEKLVAKEKLNCLVVNLYLGNEGYSLMLKTRTGGDTETIRLPYEEGEILQYIDNEELPPLLIDLLERSQANLFYNGCVIVEVRDYRRTSNPSTCDYHHVLLRPTTQTIISDVGMLTSDGQRWTWDERQALESALLLATSEPLCLDPSVSVAILANHLHHRKRLFSRRPFKKLARKHSQATINKKRKFEHCMAPPNLKLYDFLAKRRNKLSSQPLVNLKLSKQVVDNWKQQEIHLESPENIEVEDFAISLKRLKDFKETKDLDAELTIVEEYTMEAEKTTGKVHYTHITILQRPSDGEYFGKLCIGQDAQQSGTSSCFQLGNKLGVQKYINQFSEIFTEEGRKCVKITHLVPGQPPKISYTPGAMEILGAAVNTSVSAAGDVSSASSDTIKTEPNETVCSKKLALMSKLATPVTNVIDVTTSQPGIIDVTSLPIRTTPVAPLIMSESSPTAQTKAQSPISGSANNQGGNSETAFSPVSSPSSTDLTPVVSSSNRLSTDNLMSPPQNLISAVNLKSFGIGLPSLVTLSGITQSTGTSVAIPLVTPQSGLLSSPTMVVTGMRSQDNCSVSTTASLSSSISSVGPIVGNADATTTAVDSESMTSDVASTVILSPSNLSAQLMASAMKVPALRTSSQPSLQASVNQSAPVLSTSHSVRSSTTSPASISPWNNTTNIMTHNTSQKSQNSSSSDSSSQLASSSGAPQRRHKLQMALQKQYHQQVRQQQQQQQQPSMTASRTKNKKKSSSNPSTK